MNETIYYYLIFAELLLALLSFVSLFYVSAPYGRFLRGGWGPGWPSRMAWVIYESPAVWVILIVYLLSPARGAWVPTIFILLWEFHYIRRTYIYPLQIPNNTKPFPVSLAIMAIVFNTLNGITNGYAIGFLHTYTVEWLYDPRFIIGLLLFFTGWGINLDSDTRLQQFKMKSPGKYVIPHGGLFRWVSNPHYLGEIIEWTGWAILTWTWAGLAFALFTIANLLPRALSHHKWYKEHFAKYPANRKAIIPGIL